MQMSRPVHSADVQSCASAIDLAHKSPKVMGFFPLREGRWPWPISANVEFHTSTRPGRNLLPKSTVTKLPRDRESTLHLTPPSRSPAARLGRSQEVSEEVSRGGLERSREASGGLKRRPREVSRGLGRPQEVSRGLGRPRRRSQKVSGGLKRPRRRSQEVSGGLGGGLSGTRAPHETRPSLP